MKPRNTELEMHDTKPHEKKLAEALAKREKLSRKRDDLKATSEEADRAYCDSNSDTAWGKRQKCKDAYDRAEAEFDQNEKAIKALEAELDKMQRENDRARYAELYARTTQAAVLEAFVPLAERAFSIYNELGEIREQANALFSQRYAEYQECKAVGKRVEKRGDRGDLPRVPDGTKYADSFCDGLSATLCLNEVTHALIRKVKDKNGLPTEPDGRRSCLPAGWGH